MFALIEGDLSAMRQTGLDRFRYDVRLGGDSLRVRTFRSKRLTAAPGLLDGRAKKLTAARIRADSHDRQYVRAAWNPAQRSRSASL